MNTLASSSPAALHNSKSLLTPKKREDDYLTNARSYYSRDGMYNLVVYNGMIKVYKGNFEFVMELIQTGDHYDHSFFENYLVYNERQHGYLLNLKTYEIKRMNKLSISNSGKYILECSPDKIIIYYFPDFIKLIEINVYGNTNINWDEDDNLLISYYDSKLKYHGFNYMPEISFDLSEFNDISKDIDAIESALKTHPKKAKLNRLKFEYNADKFLKETKYVELIKRKQGIIKFKVDLQNMRDK